MKIEDFWVDVFIFEVSYEKNEQEKTNYYFSLDRDSANIVKKRFESTSDNIASCQVTLVFEGLLEKNLNYSKKENKCDFFLYRSIFSVSKKNKHQIDKFIVTPKNVKIDCLKLKIKNQFSSVTSIIHLSQIMELAPV